MIKNGFTPLFYCSMFKVPGSRLTSIGLNHDCPLLSEE